MECLDMDNIILEMRGITKTFPGVKALNNVNFKVREGEIHALVGENGAGKSTLMKVLSGVYPAGTYEGQTEDVATAAVGNMLVTHSDVPEETAYQMTKQLFENLDRMTAAHAAAKAIKLEAATEGMPVPLHPGAERYYKEKGVIK